VQREHGGRRRLGQRAQRGEYGDWLDGIDADLAAHRQATGPVIARLSLRRSQAGATDRFAQALDVCRSRKAPLVITINGAPDDIMPEVHVRGGPPFVT